MQNRKSGNYFSGFFVFYFLRRHFFQAKIKRGMIIKKGQNEINPSKKLTKEFQPSAIESPNLLPNPIFEVAELRAFSLNKSTSKVL